MQLTVVPSYVVSPSAVQMRAFVGTGETVGIGDVGTFVGADVNVGADVGDATRHTRHPAAGRFSSEYHEMLVDELTATQSGPDVNV